MHFLVSGEHTELSISPQSPSLSQSSSKIFCRTSSTTSFCVVNSSALFAPNWHRAFWQYAPSKRQSLSKAHSSSTAVNGIFCNGTHTIFILTVRCRSAVVISPEVIILAALACTAYAAHGEYIVTVVAVQVAGTPLVQSSRLDAPSLVPPPVFVARADPLRTRVLALQPAALGRIVAFAFVFCHI